MYCPSCGTALSQKLKYCNRCGAKLVTADEASKERLDEYLTGLFWITVFGLGLILGGIALMKEVQLNEWIIIAYLILSSTAFIINFALNLWEILNIIRSYKEAKGTLQTGQLDTNGLGPVNSRTALDAAPSVTESTTRSLEPVSKEQIRS